MAGSSFNDVAVSMHMTSIALVCLIIAIGVLMIIIVSCCCCKRCCKKCCKRRKGSKGPDDKTIQLLGEACKEKAQADLQEKEGNPDDPENGCGLEKPPEIEDLGSIQYRLDYEFNSSALHVTVLKCENLPSMDVGGTSDPYVKVYLLPDKKKKYETKVQKKTLNPVYNETFTYKLPFAEVIAKTLTMCVYDHDRLSKHDIVGTVKIPLCLVDLGQTAETWKKLEKFEIDSKQSLLQLGDVCFSIRYVPSNGKLSVVVLEAKNLKKMDVGGGSDPYVKVCLYQNTKRLKKKKTTVKKNTLNPYYNESFSFEMPFNNIQSMYLQVTVVDHDRIGHSDPIGRIVLGMHASGPELAHWAEMIATPRRPVAQWHKLKDPEEANVLIKPPPKKPDKPADTSKKK